MSTRCHVATRKGLFTLERSAGEWKVARVSFLGDNCTLAMHDPRNGDLLATLNHGHFGVKLHRSRDGGVTWMEMAAPKYPAKPEGYVPKVPVEGKAAEWSLQLIWALTPAGTDQPGVIWCGTLPGGLFRSGDGGETWELNTRYGTTRGAKSGLAAAWMRPGFTPFAWTRGIRSMSP